MFISDFCLMGAKPDTTQKGHVKIFRGVVNHALHNFRLVKHPRRPFMINERLAVIRHSLHDKLSAER